MDSISIRQLGRFSTVVVKGVEEDGEVVLVTRQGKPAAYLVAIQVADQLGLERKPGER